MSDKTARLVIQAYPVLVLSNEWLEELFCPKCGTSRWGHVTRGETGSLSVDGPSLSFGSRWPTWIRCNPIQRWVNTPGGRRADSPSAGPMASSLLTVFDQAGLR